MARTVSEWVGKTDDAAIPGDVKLRIWNRAKGHCQICTRKILAGEVKHFDHIKPLADGGRHAEKNLQIACVACHATKTAGEATERAKVKAVAKSVLGLKRPKQKIPTNNSLRTKPERDPNKGLPPLPPRKLYEERA
jgi:5-methylcytosine-specific restriction protein A